ncbi:Cation transport protein chaC [Caballeronia sordidicola]|uniref:Cation transport protein chaC n=1 Tax=Caballeronia sordidicola TaxID=196367 RepID=A0A242MXJ7_CABSO|nr:Cation transport protein chaC [Caballeronia sordidicola]
MSRTNRSPRITRI